VAPPTTRDLRRLGDAVIGTINEFRLQVILKDVAPLVHGHSTHGRTFGEEHFWLS
jgi:hypothetical protein